MFDIIIIGAGIAGLTSAIYASRAGKKVLIIEKKFYGGQIINSPKVENYPGFDCISGFDLATNLYNQVVNLNVSIRYEEVINITSDKFVITDKEKYEAKAIIIATGLENKKLGIDNEDIFIGNGISYCATCDGNFFKGKDVAVVGGGNTAIEEVLYLSNICNKIHLIHYKDKFKADNIYLEKLKKLDNIIVHLNSSIIKINGSSKVEEILINDSGRENLIKLDGIFIAIGKIPNNEIFRNVVDMDEKGYILSNDECITSSPFIFVAGDCKAKKVRQLVTASSDGAIAAISAIHYLEGIE